MIYLFVTGKSSAYLDDIFTTLSLPAGVQHCYKFPQRSYSVSTVQDTYEKEYAPGAPVLISYFDKWPENGASPYIPLRCGTLKSYKREEEQYYYDVILKEYCHTDDEKAYSEHNLKDFQNLIYHKDKKGIFAGVFVIQNDEQEDKFIKKCPESSWKRTVEKLGERALFKRYYSIFTKLELLDGKDRPVKPIEGKEYDYDLVVGKEYRLKVSYYIPQFNTDTMSVIPVCMEDSRDVCGVLKKEYFMESRQGRIVYKLWPVHKSEMLLTSLAVVIKGIEEKKVRYSKKAVDVRVRSRIRKGVRCVILVFSIAMFCIFSLLNALPYKDIIEDARELLVKGDTLPIGKRIIYEISMMLDEYKYVYSPICSVITTIATYFLVKFTGKAKI